MYKNNFPRYVLLFPDIPNARNQLSIVFAFFGLINFMAEADLQSLITQTISSFDW